MNNYNIALQYMNDKGSAVYSTSTKANSASSAVLDAITQLKSANKTAYGVELLNVERSK